MSQHTLAWYVSETSPRSQFLPLHNQSWGRSQHWPLPSAKCQLDADSQYFQDPPELGAGTWPSLDLYIQVKAGTPVAHVPYTTPAFFQHKIPRQETCV